MTEKRRTDLTTSSPPLSMVPAMPPGASMAALADSLNVTLTDEQKAQLAPKIAAAQTELAKQSDEAEQRLRENTTKMVAAIEYTRKMNQMNVDRQDVFEGDGWKSTVTKNSNQVVIIIAIIVGVVAMVVLSR